MQIWPFLSITNRLYILPQQALFVNTNMGLCPMGHRDRISPWS